MHVAPLALVAWPVLAHPSDVDLFRQGKLDTRVLFLDADRRADFPRVLNRIESSSDIVVYRLQLAGGDQLLAQLGRGEAGKLALAAESGHIAVLYPDLGEPYRGIFAKIIEGIEAQVGAPVASFAVGGALSDRKSTRTP